MPVFPVPGPAVTAATRSIDSMALRWFSFHVYLAGSAVPAIPAEIPAVFSFSDNSEACFRSCTSPCERFRSSPQLIPVSESCNCSAIFCTLSPVLLPASSGNLCPDFVPSCAIPAISNRLSCPSSSSSSPWVNSRMIPYSPSNPGSLVTSPFLNLPIPSEIRIPDTLRISSNGISRRMENSGPSFWSRFRYSRSTLALAEESPTEAPMISGSGTRLSNRAACSF